MPSLKRDRLLSDLERERLTKRETLDRHIRTTNDVRVKKKLSAWLKGVGDVLKILDDLPQDQIRDITTDQDIYILFNIIQDLLLIRKYCPIEGKEDKSDDWQTVVDENTKRPSDNLDIIRSSMLGYYIKNVRRFYGEDNPLGMVGLMEELDDNPHFQGRLTDDDRKAIKRLKQAREWFYIEMGWPLKESGEGLK